MQQRFFSKTLGAVALCAATASSTWAADLTDNQTMATPAVMKSGELSKKLIWLAAGKSWNAYYQCINDCMDLKSGNGQYATTFSDKAYCNRVCKSLRPKN